MQAGTLWCVLAAVAAARGACSGGAVERVTEECAEELSVEEAGGITVEEVGALGARVKWLAGRHVGAWGAAQCAGLGYEGAHALTGEQCVELSPPCVAGMSAAAVGGLQRGCIGQLSPEAVAGLPVLFAEALPTESWAGLSKQGVAALDEHLCAAIPAQGMRFIRSCRGLSRQCLHALNAAAVAAMHPACMAQVKASVLRGAGAGLMELLSDAAVAALTAPQAGVLDAAECGALRSTAVVQLRRLQCSNMTAGCAAALAAPSHLPLLPQECRSTEPFGSVASLPAEPKASAAAAVPTDDTAAPPSASSPPPAAGRLLARAPAPPGTRRSSGAPVVLILMLTLVSALYLVKSWIDPRIARLARGGVEQVSKKVGDYRSA